jgi:serine protease inhibitor
LDGILAERIFKKHWIISKKQLNIDYMTTLKPLPILPIALAFMATLLFWGCTTESPTEEPGEINTPIPVLPRTDLEAKIAASTQGLGFRLMVEIDSQYRDLEMRSNRFSNTYWNAALSPFSATMDLGMATLGANGTTRAQMAVALDLPATSDSDLVESLRNLKATVEQGDTKITLTTANSAWLRKDLPVLPSWKAQLQRMGATAETVDFGAPATRLTINEWVNQGTRGIIPKIIEDGEDLDPNLAIMLINATYFKGAWSKAFDTQQTRQEVFYLPVLSSEGQYAHITTPFLNDAGKKASYLVDTDFTAAALTFGNGGREMVFVLPDSGATLTKTLSLLAADPQRLSSTRFSASTLDISIPIFHLKSDLNLIPSLVALGMRDPFSLSADFSKIATQPLIISKVKQLVDVSINAEGAEAAAVTRVDMVDTALPPSSLLPPRFNANRPFLFVIREAKGDGAVLFLGEVHDPASN